ncbi:hypothetical protein DsansV1_C11g0112951 [Dioscorea sansibarensis]
MHTLHSSSDMHIYYKTKDVRLTPNPIHQTSSRSRFHKTGSSGPLQLIHLFC